METTPSSNAPKAKTLGLAALTLKLMLLTSILLTIIVVSIGVFSSDGHKEYSSFRRDKKRLENKYTAVDIKWSEEDKMAQEYGGFSLAIIALVISIVTSILQCVLLFVSKERSTASKLLSFGDTFLCLVGFACLLTAGAVLIDGSAKHCENQESLSMVVTIRHNFTGRLRRAPRSHLPFFGKKLKRFFHLIVHDLEHVGRTQQGYKDAPAQDLLYFSATMTVKHRNASKTRSDNLLKKYKKPCVDRWSSGTKVAGGALGIVFSLGFLLAAVLSLLGALRMNSTEKKDFQKGTFQGTGSDASYDNNGATPSSSPSYLQRGDTQGTPSYIGSEPSQFQVPEGYQWNGGYGPEGVQNAPQEPEPIHRILTVSLPYHPHSEEDGDGPPQPRDPIPPQPLDPQPQDGNPNEAGGQPHGFWNAARRHTITTLKKIHLKK